MSLQDILQKIAKSNEFRKPFTLKGIRYILQVLSVEQEKMVNAAMEGRDTGAAEYYTDYRKELLSRAIVEIDNETIPAVVEIEIKGEMKKKDKVLFLKDEILSSFSNDATERMFDAYIDLREQSAEEIQKETEYEWFKTPEERAKESEERIKKEQEKIKEEEKEEDEEIEKVDLKKVNESENPDIPNMHK